MTPDPLERLIGETLKSLPPHKAPRSLESRVFAEIARRAALPWWRKSWSYWPSSVRWTFLVVSASISAAIIYGFVTLMRTGSLQAVGQSVHRPLNWLSGLVAAGRAVGGAAADVLHLVPTPWLYGGAVALALLYATLLGLGATAYRMLWQTR